MGKDLKSSNHVLFPRHEEDGFILVTALVILLLLVVLGISTTTNTNIELKIAGNDKVDKQNFSMAEGGSYIEAGKVGVSSSPYQVSDPGKSDQILTVIPAADQAAFKADDPDTWPAFSLNSLSYNSLVTYLYADTPPKGYDASQFSTYKFRIDGAKVTNGQVVIELGGNKIGVKVSM
ncbi:PilX N-terminal domain-containing pilus assembly protein [Desulfobacterota bacterium M19]